MTQHREIKDELSAWMRARNDSPDAEILLLDAEYARKIGLPTLSAICFAIELVNEGHEWIGKGEIVHLMRSVLSTAVGEATARVRLVTGNAGDMVPGVPAMPVILLEEREG